MIGCFWCSYGDDFIEVWLCSAGKMAGKSYLVGLSSEIDRYDYRKHILEKQYVPLCGIRRCNRYWQAIDSEFILHHAGG